MQKIDDNFSVYFEMIETPHGTFTSNEHLGFTAREVYEKWLYDLNNPQPKPPTLEETVQEQEVKITTLQTEVKEAKQENADLYFELMMGGVI